MADLFNQQISATYSGLLKTTSSGVLTSSLTQITDGRGNGSPLYISTTVGEVDGAINFYNAYTFPSADGAADQVLSTNAGGVLSWVDVGSGDVNVSGTPSADEIAIWTDATTIKGDPTFTIDSNHKITLYQPTGETDKHNYNIGGGNINAVTGISNTGFGKDNLSVVTEGYQNIALGGDALKRLTLGAKNIGIGNQAAQNITEGLYNIAIGYQSLNAVTTTSNNIGIGNNSLSGTTGTANIVIGNSAGSAITTGSRNIIIGSNNGSSIAALDNRIIISDGAGNVRQTFDDSGAATFNGALSGTSATFSGTTAVASAAATSQMRIDRSGSVARIQNYDVGSVANISMQWDGGNVGIGTSSPLGNLEVRGANRAVSVDGIFQVNSSTSQAVNLGGSLSFGGVFTGTAVTEWAQISGRKENSTDGNYAGYLAFATRPMGGVNTERMRITSGGDVIVNNTFMVLGNNSAYSTHHLTTAAANVAKYDMYDASGNLKNSFSAGGTSYIMGGSVGFGTTSAAPTVDSLYIESADNFALYSGSNGTATSNHMVFGNGNSWIGSITTSGSATAYNTSSDYRLKENVTPITDALSRINQLKPSRFNFISESDKTVDGFLAHEVQEIIPEAISGEKDALNEDGTPNYQGIDQSKIVPLLVAAIQEQQTIIEELKARIEKLEV